jgi:TRAP transporter TAXI family solute receptor
MAIRDYTQGARRFLLIALITTLILTGAAIWLAVVLIGPPPPRSIAMATDPEGSVSAELGARYREILATNGIEVRLVPSVGAVENVARLRDPKSGISVAIIPSGITSHKESPELASLGTLFYEPLWFFYRSSSGMQKHEDLRGRRISIGPEGSGTHALSLIFLARVGVIDQTATLLPLPPQEASDKLRRGEIDAAAMLAPWESPIVNQLVATADLQLANVARADAFVALFPFLNKVVLPAGVGDMMHNRPPTDVTLIAPKASLIVRTDLHPAIQYLLLEAAVQIHSGPGMFRKAGEFPAAQAIDLPLSDNARQFYKTGPPFLQRHLPFGAAVLVQQLLVILIPVLGIMYPLLRFLPAVYAWAMRRRVFRLYGELKYLEDQLISRSANQNVDDLISRLDRLEDRASRFRLPVSFRPLLYALRLHIDLVHQRLRIRDTSISKARD